MSERHRREFLSDITSNGSEAVNRMLATIDAEKSECWKPEDKIRIFDAVRKTVGFQKLNSIVNSEVFASCYDIAKFLKYATREDLETAYKAISVKNSGNYFFERLLRNTKYIFTRPILSAEDIDRVAYNKAIQSLETTMNHKEVESSGCCIN